MHQQEKDNILHERASILKLQGYRGFMVTDISHEWENNRVTVKNKSDKTIVATGETMEEAYQNAIEQIDLFVD